MSQPSSPPDPDALIKQIGIALIRSAPQDWQTIKTEFRAAGRYYELSAEIETEAGGPTAWTASHDIALLFARLRSAMHSSTPGGTWFNARYTIARPSRYNVEYDREEPKWRAAPPLQALHDELRYFPRAEEDVPEWLVMRLSGIGQQNERRFRVARIFDGKGATGRPSVNRPPVPEADRERLRQYLDGARLILPPRGTDVDVLSADGRRAVPVAFHSDGTWIWPAAVNYYLARYGLPPEPGLVEHARTRDFVPPEVDDATSAEAAATVTGRPPGQPAGAAPPPGAATEAVRKRLDQLGVPREVYRIGGDPTPQGWTLSRAGTDWRIDDPTGHARTFDDEHDAAAFLLGSVLLGRRPGPRPAATAPPAGTAPAAGVRAEPVAPQGEPATSDPAAAGLMSPASASVGAADPAAASPAGEVGDPGVDMFAEESPGTASTVFPSGADDRAGMGAAGLAVGGTAAAGVAAAAFAGVAAGDTPPTDNPAGLDPASRDAGGSGDAVPGHAAPGDDAGRDQPGQHEAAFADAGHGERDHDADPRGADVGSTDPGSTDLGGQHFAAPDADAQQFAGPDVGGQEFGGPGAGAQPFAGPDARQLGGADVGGQEFGGPSAGAEPFAGPDARQLGGADVGGQEFGGPEFGSAAEPVGFPPPADQTGYPPAADQGAFSPAADQVGHPPAAEPAGFPSVADHTGYPSAGDHVGHPPGAEPAGYAQEAVPLGYAVDTRPGSPDLFGDEDPVARPATDVPYPVGLAPEHAQADAQDAAQAGLPTAVPGFRADPADPAAHADPYADSAVHADPAAHADPAPEAGGRYAPQPDAFSASLEQADHARRPEPDRYGEADWQGGDEPARHAIAEADRADRVDDDGAPGGFAVDEVGDARPDASPFSASELWKLWRLSDDPPGELYRRKEADVLEPGTEIDRYGEPDGSLTYARGTPFGERSLPEEWGERELHSYRVTRELDVLTGTAVSWFDQPGGGTAHLLPRSIVELVADGTLEEF